MLRKLTSFKKLKNLYDGAPPWLRGLYAAIPFSVRMGPVFRRTAAEIARMEFASREEIDAIQAERLQRLISHAFEHVPHFRDVMNERGIRPADIATRADLRRLPPVSRSEMRDRPEAFTAAGGLDEPAYWDNTGGSSGTPFKFLQPNSSFPVELAHMYSQWRRIGYSPRESRLTLRGRQVGKDADAKWQYNEMYNELQFSSYDITPASVKRLLRELERFRPSFIYGYPSAITLFCKTLREADLRLPSPIKGALCASEALYDYQRELIRDVLGCRSYSWYGQSERVCLAGECEHSHHYHSFPTYGVLELIDDEGEAIDAPGVEGEIVATSLRNFAMPFIRYRTGDRGILDEPNTCECGRNYRRLKTVTGRTQDYVVLQDGQLIPVTALVFGQHFAAFAAICGMQLHQEQPGRMDVHIIRNESYSKGDEREIRDKMETATHGKLAIEFQYVSQLSTTAAGKTPFVIQHIDEDPSTRPL